MLGRDVVWTLQSRGHRVDAPERRRLDISDSDACRDAMAADLDAVVNCAGWTDVEAAEGAEAAAFAVNAVGAGNLARAARAAGTRIVHVSTDYVFAGHGSRPYAENAGLSPASAYGRTKAAGEWAVRAEHVDHLVLRTAWLYGEHGRCFPKTIARLAAGQHSFDVVDDQWGQPTWTVDVSDLLVRLVEARVPAGTYHATASGKATWCAFAREVVASTGRDPGKVRAVATSGFPSRVARPACSVLGHGALVRSGVAPIGDWRERWRLAADRVLR